MRSEFIVTYLVHSRIEKWDPAGTTIQIFRVEILFQFGGSMAEEMVFYLDFHRMTWTFSNKFWKQW